MSMIERGDLVMVVRGHSCTLAELGGAVFTVAGFEEPHNGGWRCVICGKHSAGPNEIGALFEGYPPKAIPISWLRKIPPIEDLETRETETVA